MFINDPLISWNTCCIFCVLIILYICNYCCSVAKSLSSTISRSLLKFMSIESIMPSNISLSVTLFLFLPSIFPSIRVFSSESSLHISNTQPNLLLKYLIFYCVSIYVKWWEENQKQVSHDLGSCIFIRLVWQGLCPWMNAPYYEIIKLSAKVLISQRNSLLWTWKGQTGE